MQFLSTIGIFVILVILGTILNNLLPRIPAALFQIGLGAILALSPLIQNFEFNTATFLTLVIAPLLFTDSYKISRSKFWLYKNPILMMSVVLVLISVFIVGYIINLLIPSIPISAAFALAAILSPTDAVAVKSITKGLKLPKGLMDILEGESLLNDAAGLVSFSIALSAVITGTFSIASATQNFIKVALGGALIGLVLGLILIKVKSFLGSLVSSEASAMVIFQIVTPIFVYTIAEHNFHVSGIVAVVITGIIYNLEKDIMQEDNVDSESSLLIENNQTTIGYVLNGFVFVLLGYLLPEIFINMYEYKELTIKEALFYALIITTTMMLTRFLFVYIFYIRFPAHTFTSLQKIGKALTERKLDIGNYTRFEYALITSLSGIHGTITIATALLIPITLPSGEIFPLRNTILFIASCVVLLSMIIGTIFLPKIIKIEEDLQYKEAIKIRRKAIKETIEELKSNHNHTPYVPNVKNDKEVNNLRKKQISFAMVIKKLEEQYIYYYNTDDVRDVAKDLNSMYKELLTLEKTKLKTLEEKYNIKNSIIYYMLEIRQLRRTKLLKYSISEQVILQIKLAIKEYQFRRALTALSLKTIYDSRTKENNKKINSEEIISKVTSKLFPNFQEITKEFNDVALDFIKNQAKNYNETAVFFLNDIIINFTNVLFIRYVTDPTSYKEQYDELLMEAIQLQKYRIMTMKKLKHIAHEDADIILRDLNYSEALLFTKE